MKLSALWMSLNLHYSCCWHSSPDTKTNGCIGRQSYRVFRPRTVQMDLSYTRIITRASFLHLETNWLHLKGLWFKVKFSERQITPSQLWTFHFWDKGLAVLLLFRQLKCNKSCEEESYVFCGVEPILWIWHETISWNGCTFDSLISHGSVSNKTNKAYIKILKIFSF